MGGWERITVGVWGEYFSFIKVMVKFRVLIFRYEFLGDLCGGGVSVV